MPVWVFVKIDIRRLFRDKVSLFFVFAFPLIFLVVFGGIFGGNNEVSFKIAVINQANNSFAADFVTQLQKNEIFEIDAGTTDLKRTQEKLSRGELDAAIVLPPDFGAISAQSYPTGQAKVLYSQDNQQAGQTLGSVLTSIFDNINDQFIPAKKPFTVQTQSTASASATPFDYTFSGLLGFTVLSLGVFGPTQVFPRLKNRGVLRRYHTTTLKVWQYFIGNVISNGIAGLLSVGLLLTVALAFYDLNMRGNYLTLALLIIFGVTVLFGIGLAIGGWAKNEKQAAPLANIVTFPMLFLSGAFFPRFLMPEWLQNISGLVPLAPVIDGVRLIITENASLLSLAPQFGILFGWLIIIYLIAFRVFRWE